MKYIKRPIPIIAIQWTGYNFDQIANFMSDNHPILNAQNEIIVSTLEGEMRVPIGSYIICDVTGKDFYPCQKDVFEKSYIPLHEDRDFTFYCSSCNMFFNKKNPDVYYDSLKEEYKYWTFCPKCNRRVSEENT